MAVRQTLSHFRLIWRLAVLLLAALICLPAVALAQSPPGTPSSVTATRTDGTLTATWPAVSGATKYHVTYSTDNRQSWSLAALNHTTNSITITSVDNAKPYVVGVRAGNDDGQWSGWRNSDSIAPLSPPPATPASVSVTRADGTLTVSGYSVSNADKYHVTYSSNGGNSWTSAADNHTGSSITISGADNAKTYVVGVRAGNAGGWSGWRNSPASGPYTPPTRGIAVEDSSGNPLTALAVPEGGEASYYVKLTAPPTEETKVCVYLSVRDKNDPDITFKGEAADVVAIDVVFTPDNWDVAQTVTLVAAEDEDYVDGERDSGLDARKYYSGYVTVPVTEVDNDTPPAAPAAPSSVTVTRANGTLTVTGYAVSGATKYHVTYSPDNMWSWTAASDNHTGTSITISGADNAKAYIVGVRAGNDGGWSGWTNSAAAGPFVPSPANFTVTNGDGYLDIARAAVSAAAQAANRAGNAANTHQGSGRGEAATSSPGYATNLTSAQSGDSDVDAAQRQAVAFTTGPSPGGYTLKRFTAALRKVSGDADLVLTLHDMASDAYGEDSQPSAAVLATLSGSAPASGAYADVTYTCSGAGCDLQPDTTYFVVAQSSGTGAYAWAYVASANLYTETTMPSDSGWTLGASHYAQDGEAWASFGDWHHARIDFETHPVLSVGNLAEVPHQDACFPSGDAACAVGFTTGSAAGGYTLRAITARFKDADDPDGNLGDLVVTLHADNAGLPGQSPATLSGDNPTEAGDYTYTCSGAGCALKPDTTYFVQASATAGAYLSEAYAWSATLSDHQTPVPSGNGWTLANGTTAYRSTWQTYPDVGLLAIFATP